MLDPCEGVDADGMIRTGVDRWRVPAVYEPVVEALVAGFAEVADLADVAEGCCLGAEPSLLLYGSLATGTARPPGSDVDAVTVGLPASEASALARRASSWFVDLCRGVEVGSAQGVDYEGDDDEAYGNRVFLRHYCVSLAGPDVAAGWGPFPADVRAARGFNGDVAEHLARWRSALDGLGGHGAAGERGAALLGRRVARKALLAVAGLVSVHDRGWTTDRVSAAHRWSQLRPAQARGLQELVRWSEAHTVARRTDLQRVLDDEGAVARVVASFRHDVGVWEHTPGGA